MLHPGARIVKSRYEISQEGLGPLMDYFFSPLEFLKIARYYFFSPSEPSRSPLGPDFEGHRGARAYLKRFGNDFGPMSGTPRKQKTKVLNEITRFFTVRPFLLETPLGPLLEAYWGGLGGLFWLKQGRLGRPRRPKTLFDYFFLP